MSEVRIYRLDRTPVGEQGRRWFTDVFAEDVAKNALVAYKKLPPGTPLGSYHYHEKCENFLVVLQGQLECLVGNVRYLVNENEVIYMPDKVPHATGNCGEVECHAVEFYSPSRGTGPDMDSHPAELPAEIVDAVGAPS
jgi:mannose-6-phosphate isomerase-like protein (cupin superfamily)